MSTLEKEDLPTNETCKKAHYEYLRLQADPSADPKVVEMARRRFMFQLDYLMSMRAAKDEGIAEAEAKWQADKIETARKLKLRGVDCEKIAQVMGLSIDDVERLN
jgi:predicted transposase/invertase (TIGR01784 family)